MSRNIKYQFKNAIEGSFKPGMDKHSAKVNEKIGTDRVYSYADRNALIDLSANFSNYMATAHPDIKLLADIKSDHVQEFLDSKARNCTQETLKQYHAKFTKLEKVSNKAYNLKLNYSKQIYMPKSEQDRGKVRNLTMSEADYKSLVKVSSTSNSHAVKAIEVARAFGLRVSEATKLQNRDINLEKMTLHAIGKGGKERNIPIQEKDVKLCEKLKAACYSDNQRIVPIKSDSVNRFISRQFEKLGVDEYKNAKTGVHALRKMYAQEHFDRCRAEGMTINQALSNTSVVLGHGENRLELMQQYVGCIK